MIVGQVLASLLFEQERFAGFKSQDRNPGGDAGVDRLGAEAGDIEAQVVVFFGHFDRDGASVLPGEPAAAGEAWVGALESLHREDGTGFDDDRLSDFEPGDLFGDMETKLDVKALGVGDLRAKLKAAGRHQGL
jgi:hypothetical protein